MREPHRWPSSLVEGHSRRILLDNHEGRLHRVCVRMDGFKLEEGELFKEDFRKLLKQ